MVRGWIERWSEWHLGVAIHLESKSPPSGRGCSFRPCGFGEDLNPLFMFSLYQGEFLEVSQVCLTICKNLHLFFRRYCSFKEYFCFRVLF